MPLLTVQLSTEDHATLKARAKATGTTMAAYIRFRCLVDRPSQAPSRTLKAVVPVKGSGPPPLTLGPAPGNLVPGLSGLLDETLE